VRSYAEISRPQLAANYQALRSVLGPPVEILAVVKADAYGHGAVETTRALESAGARWFGVTCVVEALELRRAGVRGRLLVLEDCLPSDFDALAEHDLTPAVQTVEQLAALDAWASRRQTVLRVHVEFDSGLGRLGMPEACAAEVADRFLAAPYLRLEGLSTHFAASEDFTSAQTEEQISRFARLLAHFESRSLHPAFVHMANSAAIAYRPDTWKTMVRPGLALYGYFLPPSGSSAEPRCEVRPVLTWKARILAVRDFPAGVPLGYLAAYRTERPMRVAVVAAGYADGVDRRLSNGGPVLAGGRRTGVLGLVSMDTCLLDLTAAPHLRPGDYVTLLGSDGSETLTALDLANYCHTIPYEILCGIGRRVPRRYL
jgi:alanine racemase